MGRAALFSVMLLALTLLGLVLLPSWNANSGVIAAQGTSVHVNPESDAFIPFSVSQASNVSGSLKANFQIQVFVVNSTQFRYVGPYEPPTDYFFSSGYVNSVALNLSLAKGSYYLVFFDIAPANTSQSVAVDITQAIKITPD